jgi:farnesyl diphosphate synthase
VIDGYLLLKEGSEVTEDEFFLACVLGWCVQWVIIVLLVIMVG